MTTDGTPGPACTFPPSPILRNTANHAQTPARPQFHPGHRATKWPIFSFVRGYDTFYDNPNGDIIEVTLFQFATPNDAALFESGWVPGGPANTRADPVIPGAEDFDSTTVDQDSADHGVIAIKENVAFVIDDVTSSTARVPVVETMARQQYAAL